MNFIKKHKALSIILLIIVLILVTLIILFNVKPEIFNFRTIIYTKNPICNQNEKISEKAFEKNLYQILGTTKHSDKLFILNNSNISSVSLKSYKNKPSKRGNAVISVKHCLENVTKDLYGKYEIINDYVVVYFEKEVYIFYYDKKQNALVDYNNYVQDGKEKYILK